jgi:formylglycine-generating enzyme required for sulfatase activity
VIKHIFRGGLIASIALFSACGKPEGSHSTEGAPGVASDRAQTGNSSPVEIVTSSGIEMVYLPGGEFTMGNNRGNPDEAPEHKVKLSGFLMDKFEVTQEMFVKVQLPNPSHWQENPKNPVERVRWRDAKQYCNERSLLEGLKPCYNEKTKGWECEFDANGYRLPTEAEWEFACRAGSGGDYDFGAADKLRQFAWFADNATEKTHPAGQKKPNRWGLYDLYGNVSEWCEDVFGPAYYKESPPADPRGPADSGADTKRVLRGGSWKSSADMCRATLRQGERTGDTDACFYTDFCGFRCVRRISAEDLQKLTAKSK